MLHLISNRRVIERPKRVRHFLDIDGIDGGSLHLDVGIDIGPGLLVCIQGNILN